MSKNNPEQKTYLDYLDKSYLEELNYKIWSTKGARFNANERLISLSRLSNLCISLLNSYLIGIGLLSVYSIYNSNVLNENTLAYSVTCLSIILLVFSQLENAKNMSKQAKDFHNCALELSQLYNKLRIFKTLKSEQTENDKINFAEKIASQYEQILQKHENHDAIDHELFKSFKRKYHKLNILEATLIKLKYYFKTAFLYHLLIIAPPILLFWLIRKPI